MPFHALNTPYQPFGCTEHVSGLNWQCRKSRNAERPQISDPGPFSCFFECVDENIDKFWPSIFSSFIDLWIERFGHIVVSHCDNGLKCFLYCISVHDSSNSCPIGQLGGPTSSSHFLAIRTKYP